MLGRAVRRAVENFAYSMSTSRYIDGSRFDAPISDFRLPVSDGIVSLCLLELPDPKIMIFGGNFVLTMYDHKC